jgi:hypothetical protein
MKTALCVLSGFLFSQEYASGYYREELEELDAALTSKLHVDKLSFAKGFVSGVADATAGVTWCPNADVTKEQIFQVVAKFMVAHPESRKNGAADVVDDALAAAFPCKKE